MSLGSGVTPAWMLEELMETLRKRSRIGCYNGRLSIIYEDDEWLITLGGGKSDRQTFARGKTFQAAANEILAKTGDLYKGPSYDDAKTWYQY